MTVRQDDRAMSATLSPPTIYESRPAIYHVTVMLCGGGIAHVNPTLWQRYGIDAIGMTDWHRGEEL